MTFVITVIQDEDGIFVVECPAIPGLREPGADGCGGGGQHQGRHPRMSRGATRTGTAAHDRGAQPGRLCRNIDGSNQATLLNPKTRRYTTAVVSSSIRRRALDLFAERAREILGPKLLDLRLFGSEARGEARPDSDLDVLVVVQPETERATLEDRVIDIAFDVNLEFGLYISPRVVTRGILDDPVWRETPFFKNVVRESIPL